jgi:hypothetical protein
MEAAMAGKTSTEQTARRKLDFPDLAQEFLRRNPIYRAQYHKVMAGEHARAQQEQEEMARRWGLSFSLFALPSGD